MRYRTRGGGLGWLLALTPALFGCFLNCDEDDPTPPSVRCPESDGVDWTPRAIHVVRSESELTPLEDGDVIYGAIGGQGTDMYGVSVLVEGDEAPRCVNGSVAGVGGQAGPFLLQPVEAMPGRWVTNWFYDTGMSSSLTVRATIGELSVTRSLLVSWDGRPELDVGTPDTAPPDTGPPPNDFALPATLTVSVGETQTVTGTYLRPVEMEESFRLEVRTSAVEVTPRTIVVPTGASTFTFDVTGVVAGGQTPIIARGHIMQVMVSE